MARVPSEAARIIGQRIRDRRTDQQLTQDRLGELAQIDPANVRAYESGRQTISLRSLTRIAFALDTTPGALIKEIHPDMFTPTSVAVELESATKPSTR
ncbi:helix-turn-helix transcriptional regulator [Pseudoclavibacter sp. CFCC 14310]|uniref:helix-turn-helix domain-containing protein n=1 Tax=Pseudoclavibacter sp. CFCC 14310 TaxID=2615180 RepID=UPI00130147B8|nr:helix-turn-helix transcriptional regulator [Pseudoclavibacter sp. CFCC 14310]KAB1647101.1 helix-turn-helix transcriptional regulator [Pseudoclavibacter sp. CFCC 14310]